MNQHLIYYKTIQTLIDIYNLGMKCTIISSKRLGLEIDILNINWNRCSEANNVFPKD